MLAEVEDRDDIGVVQPGRGAGLVAEAADEAAVGPEPTVQDLQGHVGAERLAAGLVHHAHPALADEPEDAIVPQLLRVRGAGVDHAVEHERHRADVGLQALHLGQRREEVRDVRGVLGMAVHVFGEGRPLPPAEPGDERVGQAVEGDRLGEILAHGLSPSPPSGLDPIRPLRRRSARR